VGATGAGVGLSAFGRERPSPAVGNLDGAGRCGSAPGEFAPPLSVLPNGGMGARCPASRSGFGLAKLGFGETLAALVSPLLPKGRVGAAIEPRGRAA
jgi:hypothetical protein